MFVIWLLRFLFHGLTEKTFRPCYAQGLQRLPSKQPNNRCSLFSNLDSIMFSIYKLSLPNDINRIQMARSLSSFYRVGDCKITKIPLIAKTQNTLVQKPAQGVQCPPTLETNLYITYQSCTDIYLANFCRENKGLGIESWDWNLKGEKSTYHALYPRAWTTYDGIIHIYSIIVYQHQSW